MHTFILISRRFYCLYREMPIGQEKIKKSSELTIMLTKNNHDFFGFVLIMLKFPNYLDQH